MNPLSGLSNATPPILTGLLLACLPLAPIAQAVSPLLFGIISKSFHAVDIE
jgi:hypothetical protein